VAHAGGAWLPLDPDHPPARGRRAIEAGRPAGVLTGGSVAEPIEVVPAAPGNLAYVVHTSGTTGRPRAVAVTRAGVANLLASHRAGLMGGERRRVAHTAPLTVDAAVDPLLWMTAGHELVLLRTEIYRDPHRFVDAVRAQRIEVVDVPPSYLRVLLDAGLLEAGGPSLVVFGGEAAPAELWERLPAAFNAYGPSEFTVDALLAEVRDTETPVLGTPVAGCRALVLDGALRPVPEGGVGELYLGGPGLARGYAGEPGPTATRFVADPFGPPGERLFRTGDLVRVRFDGNLEFLGRSDDQVKIRGFRVEPREVEAVLSRHPEVQACAVLARDGRLIAYVVPEHDSEAAASLLAHARSELPDHLVPAAIVGLPELPLAADGTLDRRALPEPRLDQGPDHRTPRTAAERALCACFAEVLAVDRVGVDDDFFALGGDSLRAARLLGLLRQRLGLEIGLRDVFTHRTVGAMIKARAPREEPWP
jgi:amino acid adenylation domain-containing protein